MSGHKQEARIIAMITGLMAGLAATPVTAIDDLALNVAPGSEFVEPGDTVTVTLDVANLSTPINGVQALIQYDTTFMALADIVPTDLELIAPDEGWVEVYISELWGDIDYTVVINGDPTIADGTVATLTFTVIDEGTTSVTFRADVPPYFTKLTGSDNSTIFPNRLDSGSIVSSCDDGNPCTTDSVVSQLCDYTVAPAGTLCHASTDECDPQEECNGSTTVCPVDLFDPDDSGCTDDGLGCTDDTCQSGVCTHPVQPFGFVCRASTGECDPQEECDGSATACPGDSFVSAGSQCTDTATGDCDDAQCDGAGLCDQAYAYELNTYVCRADNAGGCDAEETCDGSSSACPADVGVISGTECRAALDPDCDVAETCDGSSNPCPVEGGHIAVGTQCTDTATGDCNDAQCDGAGLCDQAYAYALNTYVCRASTDLCDAEETCDGVSGTCPDDELKPADTPCRAWTDLCDLAEFCDGVLGSCPVDDLESEGVVCRASVGLCDLDEACDGVSAACTVDAVEPAATLCRASTGPCDVEETCDGVSGTCPTDTFEPLDTPCSDGDFCNGLETCDGLGDCRASTDPCTPLLCDEVNDVCLAPVHVAGLEVFYAGRFGTCVGGPDDGLFCSGDGSCRDDPPPSPPAFCDVSEPLADQSRHFLAPGAPLFCVGGGNDGVGCTDDTDCAVCVGGVNDGQPCTDSDDCFGESCSRGTCASSKLDNIMNYARGITGIRVLFDNIVDFATTPDAAFTFEWTDPTETIFWPVTDAATAITVTATVPVDVTVVEIVLDDDHVRQRWLKVIIDSTQITSSGVELDGELVGNPVVLPSGDGTSGGDATFFVGSMPGDVSGDRKTRLFDVGQIRLQVNMAYPVPIENIYDVDKSGKVRLWDVGLTRVDLNPAFALPLISP